MQSRFWCYTINNEEKISFNNDEIIANAWQIEKGENGTTHVQGYLQLRKRRRLRFLKELHPGAHWEKRLGTHEQALAYVRKAETRIAGPFQVGQFDVAQGQRTDLLAVQQSIDDGASIKQIAEEHFTAYVKYGRGITNYMSLRQTPRDYVVDVQVHWGDPGTGKTRGCYDHAKTNGLSVYPLSQNYQGGVVWWDGYESQEIILIDDFYGWLPFSYLLRLLDRYPMLLRSRDGHLHFSSKIIWITSNKSPDEWYQNIDPIRLRALRRRFSIVKHYGSMVNPL